MDEKIISCSWHQTTKPRILFYPIFSANFSQLKQFKKKRTFNWSKNEKKNLFWTNKKFVFFFNYPNWENSWKKIVVWWLDVKNKIHNKITVPNFSIVGNFQLRILLLTFWIPPDWSKSKRTQNFLKNLDTHTKKGINIQN